jgi:tripeptide aminopeptidase
MISPLPLIDRFCRYVQIDTQSDPTSTAGPTTEKQKDLGRLLVQELLKLGLMDAELDRFGYVYATLPAHPNAPVDTPTICFCAHMDTSPDVTGAGVKPIIHHRWDGTDISLPNVPEGRDMPVIISPKDHPDLAAQVGNDIITASGTTLLGADNKAGITAIMAALTYLTAIPDAVHGRLRILFTPDEEVGRGTANLNMAKLDATYGYTIDGESVGTLEDETFSADGVRIVIQGVSTHPGFAKGKLENALKIAGDLLAALPKHHLSPETTEAQEGFVHPTHMDGNQDRVVLDFIVRDFSVAGLHQHEATLQTLLNETLSYYPHSSGTFSVTEQYRNMKEVLDQHPAVTQNALEAIRRAGLLPQRRSIRGGTDGSRLSFMGLPCPNIFAGEHAFHSREEWVSVQDMQKAAEVIVHLAQIWAGR